MAGSDGQTGRGSVKCGPMALEALQTDVHWLQNALWLDNGAGRAGRELCREVAGGAAASALRTGPVLGVTTA